ncbi:MAG: 6-bladed beta-propeller [Gemmatimonadota bacterium]|nr:6-bladed beta-propeller [Gemmatimonadota bacterium]
MLPIRIFGAVGTLLALAVHAISSEVVPVTTSISRQPALRRMVRKEWKPLWRRGGRKEETLFALPREMVASSDGVYVADGGGLEVFAFDTAGKLRWKHGRKGAGPGEYLELTDLTLDRSDHLALLDARNGRLTFLEHDGKVKRTLSTGSIGWPSSVCMFANGNLLFTVAAPEHFFMIADANGKLQREQNFPWHASIDAPRFLKSGYLSRGRAENDCWFTTVFGFGVARIRADGAATTSPYIETLAPPVIRVVPTNAKNRGGEFLDSGDNAALASFTSGDTLFVFFMGKPTSEKPLLDLYGADGHYIESWNLPDGERVTYSHGRLYTLVSAMENPMLEAWGIAPRKAAAKPLPR